MLKFNVTQIIRLMEHLIRTSFYIWHQLLIWPNWVSSSCPRPEANKTKNAKDANKTENAKDANKDAQVYPTEELKELSKLGDTE